jgi:hypothetical protein
VDVPDRVRVCTAFGTCSTFTGKPLKLSMDTVPRRIPHCLRRHQREEMRVASLSACNGCKLKCEFTESRKSANRLRRCAIARRHARRLCAATGTVAPPLLDGRESVESVTPHQYVCKHRCENNRKVGKRLPRRAIALGYSPGPCAGSRKHRRPRSSMVVNRSRSVSCSAFRPLRMPLCSLSFGSSKYLEAYRRTHCPEALEVDKARGVTIP